MGFAFEYGYSERGFDSNCHYDDDDSDDSHEYYHTGRGNRRRYESRNHCSEEDLEKNRQAERNLVCSLMLHFLQVQGSRGVTCAEYCNIM